MYGASTVHTEHNALRSPRKRNISYVIMDELLNLHTSHLHIHKREVKVVPTLQSLCEDKMR